MRDPVLNRQSLFAVLLTIAFAGTYAVTKAASTVPTLAPPNLEALPLRLDGWQGHPAKPLDPEVAKVLAADHYLHRYYLHDLGGAVEVDVAYYSQRRVGASMHSPLNCLPGNGWTVSEMQTLQLPTSRGPVEVREMIVRNNKAVFALAYWYQNAGRVLTGEANMRLTLLGDALRRRPADVGLVRVMAPMTGEYATVREAVRDFSVLLLPELERSWKGR